MIVEAVILGGFLLVGLVIAGGLVAVAIKEKTYSLWINWPDEDRIRLLASRLREDQVLTSEDLERRFKTHSWSRKSGEK